MTREDDEDTRVRRTLELIVAGRLLADAGDRKEVEAYIERLEQRRDAILDSGLWKVFKRSELAEIQHLLGRARVGYQAVREQDERLLTKQISEERRYAPPAEPMPVRQPVRVDGWWQNPAERGPAETEGTLPERTREPDAVPAPASPTEREIQQAKLLERPREWWKDDGSAPKRDEPVIKPEPDRY